jgi:hypothetical protein
MSDKSTQEAFIEAVEYFRTLDPHWSALIAGLKEERETLLADIKRNTMTPVCDDKVYYATIGQMVALDDLLQRLTTS